MRICHVVYIPRFSGAEILVRGLAIAHQALGHEVAVMALMPPEPSFLEELAQMQAANTALYIPQQELGKWDRATFLTRNLKQFQPDVVVAHSVIPSAYARIAVKLAALHQSATISVLHDASQDDYASPYFRAIERWFVPKPDVVVSVSEIGAENYCTRIQTTVKPVVIPNGINLSEIEQAASQREKVRQQIFNVAPSAIVCLQVGRFGSTKQQHLALEAYARVRHATGFSGKLCFVGCLEDRAYEQALQQQIKHFELEDEILVFGSRSDIPKLLAGADIFLMPSKFEAQGIALIEALSSGITIVASDIPPFEYARSFPGVQLIQPQWIDQFAQAIQQAIPAAHTRWQRDLSAYSIEQTAQTYLDLIESLTQSAIAS